VSSLASLPAERSLQGVVSRGGTRCDWALAIRNEDGTPFRAISDRLLDLSEVNTLGKLGSMTSSVSGATGQCPSCGDALLLSKRACSRLCHGRARSLVTQSPQPAQR